MTALRPAKVLPRSKSVAGSGVGAIAPSRVWLLLKSLMNPPTPTSMSLCRNTKSTGLLKRAEATDPGPEAAMLASRSAGSTAQLPQSRNPVHGQLVKPSEEL